MNSLGHVRTLLSARGGKFALAVVATAIIAVSSASAGLSPNLCNPGSDGCSATITPTSSGDGWLLTDLSVTPLTNPANYVTGVEFSGSGSFTAGGSDLYSIQLLATGSSNSGRLSVDSLPVSYIFTVDPGEGDFTGWTVLFQISQEANVFSYTNTGTGTNVSGYGTITGLNPEAAVSNWEMLLTLGWTARETGQTLAFDLPLDINGQTPEPVPFLLVGTGISLLLLLRRRRTAKAVTGHWI